jgi:hypothetical protein
VGFTCGKWKKHGISKEMRMEVWKNVWKNTSVWKICGIRENNF